MCLFKSSLPSKNPTVQRCGWWCSSCAWPWWLWPSSFLSSSALWATTAVSRLARVSDGPKLSDGWVCMQSVAVAAQVNRQYWTHTWNALKKYQSQNDLFCIIMNFCVFYCISVLADWLVSYHIQNVHQYFLHVLHWILNCECGYTYNMLKCIQVFSILKLPFIIQQHSLYPCDIQYAWCLGPIPNPTRLFYCMIAVLYIILPLCHPPVYPSHSLASLSFLPPLLLSYKGRSVWALWMLFCTMWLFVRSRSSWIESCDPLNVKSQPYELWCQKAC